MANRPAFPGMNPYLENPALWPEVHYGLIGALMRTLNLQITPKYRAAVEKRVYMDAILVGIPDASVFEKTTSVNPKATRQTAVLSKPERVSVPMTEEVTERYLEIREVETDRVVTVVELLSPKNKRTGEGRNQYLQKRQSLLSSQTHLVEIDLLRIGNPMPVKGGRQSDYQILVSRANERPAAERYPFDLKVPIPSFLLPLRPGDIEPVIDLFSLLSQIYAEAALDLAIDYTIPPVPPLSQDEMAWMETLETD
ncbi:MAG: DUF4058 family protein [Cyanobacteria bacterium P01_A01_bin.114]